ncbi:phage major capsid protein [uncultured Tateyamaria sp.]|uniref:phage major capsid protein n=1 Tax=uncultured Tateyamaria sp. TaxID=455651 RepID=UPI00261BF067|nr:phage major capsid protein [uncultured Tateyamaria sp.]
MLLSKKLELRRSEIRQSLAELANIESPSADETRKMTELDAEYRAKEVQYRAALIAEDEERREAGAELETRSDNEWSTLIGGFEMRQVALALKEGRALDGQTAEVVTELRSQGGFTGVPVPIEALEVRNTVAAGTPDPIATRPIIDRLFPDSVASRIGAQMINVGFGAIEWPVVTSNVTVGWAATENGNVADPTPFETTDRPLKPDHCMGVQMRISRNAMQQSGAALEQAIRRDMNAAMGQEMDRAILQGSGAGGQPLGMMTGAATYGVNVNDLGAAPTYAMFLQEIVAFMTANTITSPNQVQLLIRPELFGWLEGQVNADLHMSEYIRWAMLVAGRNVSGPFPNNITTTSNGIPAPSGDPLSTSMLMTTRTGGVAPLFVGLWNNGALDLIRDPYTDAQSGGLRITALANMDVTVARPVQSRIVTNMQLS